MAKNKAIKRVKQQKENQQKSKNETTPPTLNHTLSSMCKGSNLETAKTVQN